MSDASLPPPEARGWRRLAWSAYERLPRSADALLWIGTQVLLPFTNRRIPLTMWRGAVPSGGTGTLLFAGTGASSAAYLTSRFFVDEPTHEPLGEVPVWRLRAELARRHGDADLVVARLDRISAGLALDPSYVAVPEWVGALAPVPEDPWRFCRRSKSLHNNMTRARRVGLRPRVSHDPRDFEEFYTRMYVPFIRSLHGPEGVVSIRPRMRRCFRQGGLLFAERDGRPVMGALYRRRGATLDLVVLGTAGGDLEPRRDGAGFALELFTFEHARALGCTTIDFGGSRPSPADGLLVYKARWGSRIVATRWMFYDLCLGWDRLTPQVLAFLTRTPLIFRQADGLAAVCAVGDDPAGMETARTTLRSLRRAYVVAPAGAPLAELGIPTIRVDPAAQPAWRPPRAVPR